MLSDIAAGCPQAEQELIILPEGQNCVSSVHSELKWFSIDELSGIPMVPSDALFIPELRKFYQL